MSEFSLFDYIDTALVKQESHDARTSNVPAVWPSEASANRIDRTVCNIYGACMRKSYYRMTGIPITNQVDPIGAWRWVTGRLIEGTLVDLARSTDPMIYAANGVRTFVEEFYMPLELDLVVVDPKDRKGWICECKTYYGYMAAKDIKSGKPKIENVMQTVLYLNEVRNGAKLKQLIKEGLADKEDVNSKSSRNRIEAQLDIVEQIDDGEIGAKLVYIARDDCARTEFTIGIAEDFDGAHYPVIDGQMWKIFTVESIYERFRTLQNYWFLARQEGVNRLKAKGIEPPTSLNLVLVRGDTAGNAELVDIEKDANKKYLDLLAEEVRLLPDTFLPPAEYDWSYSATKIETLAASGEIGKVKYQDWKKKKLGKDKIGDWQCAYCPYKSTCIPKQNPNWSYQLYDITSMEVDGE